MRNERRGLAVVCAIFLIAVACKDKPQVEAESAPAQALTPIEKAVHDLQAASSQYQRDAGIACGDHDPELFAATKKLTQVLASDLRTSLVQDAKHLRPPTTDKKVSGTSHLFPELITVFSAKTDPLKDSSDSSLQDANAIQEQICSKAKNTLVSSLAQIQFP